MISFQANIEDEDVGAEELGRFLMTGRTDAIGNTKQFDRRSHRKDLSVLTHGPHKILRQILRVKTFPRYQRLRLETPNWRVLDYEGNLTAADEAE